MVFHFSGNAAFAGTIYVHTILFCKRPPVTPNQTTSSSWNRQCTTPRNKSSSCILTPLHPENCIIIDENHKKSPSDDGLQVPAQGLAKSQSPDRRREAEGGVARGCRRFLTPFLFQRFGFEPHSDPIPYTTFTSA